MKEEYTLMIQPRTRLKQWIACQTVLLASTMILGCSNVSFDTKPDTDISPQAMKRYFSPLTSYELPTSGPVATRISLGKNLFYDPHLSKNNSISCNSCHQLASYGVDGNPTSVGHDGRHGGRNAPTVYNSGLEFVQFWDGRARDLTEQASGPMLNPVEMGMPDASAVVAYVRTQPYYMDQLKHAFPGQSDPATLDNIKVSIAAFEAGLITPAPWDRYLNGDTSALTEEQKQGLRVFLRSGCNTCHAGRTVGGNSYEQLGATEPWASRTDDHGRFSITKNKRDALFFKVPMLRNIEKTGPYFHDGNVATLDDAVRLMAKYESGVKLSNTEVSQVVAFLHSLTGTIPASYIEAPHMQVFPAPAAGAAKPAARQGGN